MEIVENLQSKLMNKLKENIIFKESLQVPLLI
jgi:hypothetical protein